jgi:hypothetical protein
MTGYSTSMVIVGLNAAKAVAAITHNCRNVLERDARKRQHSNEMVDSSRTDLNRTYVNDGDGHLVPMTSARQAHDYLDQRITACPPLRRRRDRKTGKVTTTETTPRVTDNIAAEYVLALDPAKLRDMTREEYQQAKLDGTLAPLTTLSPEAENWLNVELQCVTDRHRIENIITYALHLDESNPHIQVIVAAIACDEDGIEQLSYKMAFASGKRTMHPVTYSGGEPVLDDNNSPVVDEHGRALLRAAGEPVLNPTTGEQMWTSTGDSRRATQELWRRWHDEMRDKLNEAGYDATYERVDGGRRAQRLAVYKRDQDQRREEHQAIAQQRAENDRERAAHQEALVRFYTEAGELEEQRREFGEYTKKRLRQVVRDQQAVADLRAAAQGELDAREQERRQARADRLEGRRYLERAREKLGAVEKALETFESVKGLIARAEKAWSPQSQSAVQAHQVSKRLAGPHLAAQAALDLIQADQPEEDTPHL